MIFLCSFPIWAWAIFCSYLASKFVHTHIKINQEYTKFWETSEGIIRFKSLHVLKFLYFSHSDTIIRKFEQNIEIFSYFIHQIWEKMYKRNTPLFGCIFFHFLILLLDWLSFSKEKFEKNCRFLKAKIVKFFAKNDKFWIFFCHFFLDDLSFSYPENCDFWPNLGYQPKPKTCLSSSYKVQMSPGKRYV